MANLKIYRASAGSGKTFTLTREFIGLMFELPENYRKILAVTFTNKATAEMKARILEELDRMARDDGSRMLPFFMEKYGKFTRERIRERARKILDTILHDYSAFHVMTIDSFFQGVIRSFARELGLTAAYNVELDVKKVLAAAIDGLFRQLDGQPDLLGWMMEFIRERTREGKDWKLKDSIAGLGSELFREAYQEHGRELEQKTGDRDFMKAYRSALHAVKTSYGSAFSKLGKKAMEIMEAEGVRPEDFSGKSRGIGGFFRAAANGDRTGMSGTALKCLDDHGPWIANNSDKQELLEAAYRRLNPVLKKMNELYERDHAGYRTAETILGHVHILGILTDLSAEIYHYADEQDIFLISDTARFLREIMAGNPSSFIFEKTGSYIDHFMIDEFQDTSGFQWENFRPLLAESLAMNGSSLVVGDVKQSIYRWRNSDWEILGGSVAGTFDSRQVEERSLLTNRRSREEIIRFNNDFFTRSAELVACMAVPDEDGSEQAGSFREKFAAAWSDVRQEVPEGQAGSGGFIRMDFIEEGSGDFRDAAGAMLIRRLEELMVSGVPQKEIAILVRKRSEGRAVTDLLLADNDRPGKEPGLAFSVISNEALFLANSRVVRFILNVLTWLVHPDDKVNLAELAHHHIVVSDSRARDAGEPSVQGHGGDADAARLFMAAGKTNSRDGNAGKGEFRPDRETDGTALQELLTKLGRLRNLPMAELVEEIIHAFGLHRHQDDVSMLAAFQDVVLDYSRNGINDPGSFLEWWKENGDDQSLTLPEDQDAIRVLTIHKAKGLEFNIVILPFCNWNLDHDRRPVIWCTPGRPPFDMLPVVPVNYSSKLAETIFAPQYREERFRIHVDNLNLLYVAFTRARDALFAMIPLKEDLKDTASLVRSVLTSGDMERDFKGEGPGGNETWTRGRMPSVQVKVQEESESPGRSLMTDYPSLPGRGKLRMRSGQSDLFGSEGSLKPEKGLMMHRIYELIRTREDVPAAVRTVSTEAGIGEEEAQALIGEVARQVETPEVRAWFDGTWQVRNEQEILSPGGTVMRPDRVMFRGGKTVLVDYKFGDVKSERYLDQVGGYVGQLREMGMKDVSGYIWYVNLNEVVRHE